ncbi:zinc finger CCHC domain-containing protein 7 [Salmo trutta]|uniref:zinc finger CCHC domain-containing protein 7 n=1 Tax=Salmo trutta TaxID=8032 RepID=UPI00113206B0|nr:zinc finger CCHC domain-containing protein 7-like [Salmo trutta]
MFAGYVDRAELEDELYGEESEGSEVEDSELEFRLYSQLHYSSNPGEKEEEEEDRRLSSSHGENPGEEEEEEEDRRLSSSHGENPGEEEEEEEEEDGRKAKRKQPSKSRDHLKVKQKTQQGMKQQRGLSKGDPRRQRSFQEVIVIDSSQDDVITVSDNTEEDDGVCSAKGQRLKKGSLQASTPAPQRKPAPKRRSSSVDSDSLESWMILGSGKQDGDQSIILNLEGDLKVVGARGLVWTQAGSWAPLLLVSSGFSGSSRG